MAGLPAVLAALLLALACASESQGQAQVADSALSRRLAAGGTGGGTGGGAASAARCPPLTKELLQKRAKKNTVMLAVMNIAQARGRLARLPSRGNPAGARVRALLAPPSPLHHGTRRLRRPRRSADPGASSLLRRRRRSGSLGATGCTT